MKWNQTNPAESHLNNRKGRTKKHKVEIIFQDDDMLVVNKPSGLLSIPDRYDDQKPNLLGILRKKFKERDVFKVHRLDKETSGLICFALKESAHKALNEQFQEGKPEKIYWALVKGKPKMTSGEINAPIATHSTRKGRMVVNKRGKSALSRYKVIDELGPYSLLEVQIETGRTHQIRVHCGHIGHPLAFDAQYGQAQPIFLSDLKNKYQTNRRGEERPLLNRLSLHARQLSLFHPRLDKTMQWETEMPKDLMVCIKQLRKIYAPK